MNKTMKRKSEHLEIALKNEILYEKSAGFEDVILIHDSLPEMNAEKVLMRKKFLGKEISAPFIMEGMTGGYEKGGKINKRLAEVCEEENIAFGVGSQRAMLENPALKTTYYVRDVAPSIPILGNIGAVQLKKYPLSTILNLIDEIEADGLAVHLNPLQELIQPEGDRDFSGILEKISELADELGERLVVKETGAGMSASVGKRLREIGVVWVDVAGAGGTSWSKIEYLRDYEKKSVEGFEEWGIPTVVSVVLNAPYLKVIASGGLKSGIDAAKSLALGAEMAGAAGIFLRALEENRLKEKIREWKNQLKTAMCLCGAKDLSELREKAVVKGATREIIELMNVD